MLRLKSFLLLTAGLLAQALPSPIPPDDLAANVSETVSTSSNETLVGGPRPGIDCGPGPQGATPIYIYGSFLKV